MQKHAEKKMLIVDVLSSTNLGMVASFVVEFAGKEIVFLVIEVDGEATVVLGGSVVTQDVGIELHLAMCPGQLEGLVCALGEHQELDCRLVVVQALEKPAKKEKQKVRGGRKDLLTRQ